MSSSSTQSNLVRVSKESGTLNNFWKPVEKQQVDDAVADLFYTSAIPFNVERIPHFRNAVHKIAEFGKGYTPPGSEAIRTTLLQRSKDRVTEKLADVKATWKETVLRMVDGDTSCLGMLYEGMDRSTCFLEPKLFAIDRRGDNEIMAALYQAISSNLKLLMNKSAKNTSLEQTLEGMAMPNANEPNFVDDELSSDTDDDDLTSQPSALESDFKVLKSLIVIVPF
ncbi:hypothetical protein SUGI_1086180 [Cryptomeria japonica]|nr:hypothetical protein SUGI_1086180 [Cryptomeria japonica]